MTVYSKLLTTVHKLTTRSRVNGIDKVKIQMKILLLIYALSGAYQPSRNWRRQKPLKPYNQYDYSYEQANYNYNDYDSQDYHEQKSRHGEFLDDIMRMIHDDPVIPVRPSSGMVIFKDYENTCPESYRCSKIKQRSCSNGKCGFVTHTICEDPCEYLQCLAQDDGDIQKLQPSVTHGTVENSTQPIKAIQPITTIFEIKPTKSTPMMIETTDIKTTTKPSLEIVETLTTSSVTKNTHELLEIFNHLWKQMENVFRDLTNSNITTNTIPTRRPPKQNIASIHSVAMSNHTNSKVEQTQLNCQFFSRSGSFDCKDWNADTLISDLKQAQNAAPEKMAKQQYTEIARYTNRLHPIWKSIAGNIIPPFSNEVITRHMFVYCINRFFIESEKYAFLPYRKREAESMLAVVKIRMYCQIPLTQLRKKLMLEAMQHFADKCRRIRILNFIDYIMKLVENEQEVDPQVEIEMLAPALSMLVKRTAKRGWSKMQFYSDLMNKHATIDYKLSPNLQRAVFATIEQTKQDYSLASVTSTLIDNIQKQRLERKPRNFFIN